jgi:hypothetical protein
MSEFAKERIRNQMRAMEAMLPEVRRELERLPNVDHVVVGAKEVNGVATEQPAFQVYVRAKVAESELGPSETIPGQIGGFPTDVILIGKASLFQEDTDGYRPLFGGCQLQQQVGSSGTLGVIALATAGSLAPVGAPVIVTNNHVAPTIGDWVGQPSAPCDSWCCLCCDVGRVVDTRADTAVDVSIATLSSGMRFSHEILGRGVIRGSAPVATLLPAAPVFKRGRTTRLTEGRFSNATSSLTPNTITLVNQIRITPAVAGTPFALPGDSGSVIVDAQNRVVGLLFAGDDPPLTGVYANRIDDVRSAMNIDFPLIGTAGAIPLTAGVINDEIDDMTKMWLPLRSKVMASEAGRQWSEIVARHRTEVGQLVRHNRPTTTTWNRYHGPSFVSHYLKTVRDNGYLAPEEIGGIRVENLLLGMAAVLQEHGSPPLSQAIWRHYLQIIESAKDCRTVEAFLDRMTQSSPAEDVVETNEFRDSEVPVG